MKLIKPDVEIALDARVALGEGAIWDVRASRLLWVDVLGKSVGCLDPATGSNQSWELDSLVGAVVPTDKGGLLVAIAEGVARLDVRSGCIADVICPAGHNPAVVRFNDGKCDPAGRFVVGTTSITGQGGLGALYAFEGPSEGRAMCARRLLSDVSISNGLAWSLDHKYMYYIDTPTRTIRVFDYDIELGEIRNGRVACEIPQGMGFPDGMTIDAEGKLWVALWGGGAVTRWDPDTGELLCRYQLPVTHVTSCAFGGPGLGTLFITTARADLPASVLDREPLAGSILAIETGVVGIPAFYYRD